MTWPKQKMQPSAPFTTDWMTSATVPEHTSACEKHTDSTLTVSSPFSRNYKNTVTQAHGEHCIHKDITFWHCLHQITLMVSLFFITQEYVCLCVIVRAVMRGSVLQSVSLWVLWGKASAAGAPSHISQQTRPLTAEQLAVAVSHQQCCPSGTIQQLGLSSAAATFRQQLTCSM